MTKKWIAINLMLLLAAALLARQLKVSVADFRAANDTAKIQPARRKVSLDSTLPAYQPPPRFADAQVAAIYNQNLFAESRKLEDQVVAPPQPETRSLTNPPILVGALVTSSQKIGLVIDTSAPPGSRRTQQIQVGDVYQGFTVTEITDQEMVLEYGASRNVIPLSDTSKPAQSGRTPVLQTRIVNFGPASGGRGGPVTGASSRAAGGQNAAPPRSNPQQVVPMQQPAGARGAVQTTQPAPTANVPQGGLYPNQYYNAQGQLITNTPFGPMVSQPATPPQTQQPVKK